MSVHVRWTTTQATSAGPYDKAMLRRAGVGGSSSSAAIHLKPFCDNEEAVREAVLFAASIGAGRAHTG